MLSNKKARFPTFCPVSKKMGQKTYSVLETIKCYYTHNQSWDHNQSSHCLICQNPVKLTQPLATCECSCRMICHRECLTSYHQESGNCPLCNKKQKLIRDNLAIWINPHKINTPLKIKSNHALITEIKKTGKSLLFLVFLKLCDKAAKESNQPLSALIQLNQEMYKYNPYHRYLTIPIELVKPPNPFFEYKPANLETLTSFYKVLKPIGNLTLFQNRNDKTTWGGYMAPKKYAIFPNYRSYLNQLLQVNEALNLKFLLSCPGIFLSGSAIDHILTSAKFSQRPDLTLYVTGKTLDARQLSLQYLLVIFNGTGLIFDLLIYQNILNFVFNQRLIQVIVTDQNNPVEVIQTFEYTHSQFYYQTDQIHGTYEGLTALQTRTTRYIKTSSVVHQIDSSRLLAARQLGYNILLPLNSQTLSSTNLKPTEVLLFPDQQKLFYYYRKDSNNILPVEEIADIIEAQTNFLMTTSLSIDNHLFNLDWQTIPQLIAWIKAKRPKNPLPRIPLCQPPVESNESLEEFDYSSSDDDYDPVHYGHVQRPTTPLQINGIGYPYIRRQFSDDDQIEQDPRDVQVIRSTANRSTITPPHYDLD